MLIKYIDTAPRCLNFEIGKLLAALDISSHGMRRIQFKCRFGRPGYQARPGQDGQLLSDHLPEH